MESLKPEASALGVSWSRAYAAIRNSPSLYQSHLPGANAVQLDEVVKTVLFWFDRVRPPKGYAPAYRISRSLAGSSLTSAASAAESIARGEYAHFPGFILSLVQVLGALHSLLIFGQRHEAETAVADLGTQLAETLALLTNAQRDLVEKTASLQTADSSLQGARLAAEQAAVAANEAQTALKSAQGHAEASEARSEKISELLAESTDVSTKLADDAKAAGALLASATKLDADLNSLVAKTRQQQELITALLPKGASAGLASAFASRVSQLERAKWRWMGGFVVSILGLCAVAAWILRDASVSGTELWIQILQRIPLAAPLVWSGWFSAVQYGNTLRVQEDYAFKEATAKAFVGFRDHLEHMSTIAQEDGASAMAVLYGKTMKALAREPLRVFQGPEKDAAPSQALVDAVQGIAQQLERHRTSA